MRIFMNVALAGLLLIVAVLTLNNKPISEIANEIANPVPEGKIILMCADGRNNPDFPWDLCQTDQWPYVSDNIDIVKVYVGDFTPNTDPEAVRCFAEALKAKDIKIALEVGGLLDWYADKGDLTAIYSFREEYEQVKPFIEYVKLHSGFVFIDIIEYDCPIKRMLFPFDKKADYHSVETAVTELVRLTRLWKDYLPEAEINNITNFPVWGWRGSPAYFAVDGFQSGYGQYDMVLHEIVKQTEQAGIRLDGITVDNPYEYTIATAPTNQFELIEGLDWARRLLELEIMIKHYGMNANIIFNSELGGRSSSEAFALNTLIYIDLYHSLGGNPDGYWIQSWYPYPDQWLPEDQAYSMTYLMQEVLNIVNR